MSLHAEKRGRILPRYRTILEATQACRFYDSYPRAFANSKRADASVEEINYAEEWLAETPQNLQKAYEILQDTTMAFTFEADPMMANIVASCVILPWSIRRYLELIKSYRDTQTAETEKELKRLEEEIRDSASKLRREVLDHGFVLNRPLPFRMLFSIRRRLSIAVERWQYRKSDGLPSEVLSEPTDGN